MSVSENNDLYSNSELDPWPPRLEGRRIPVEDFERRLLELAEEGHEEEVDGEMVRIFDGIVANFDEMERYRSRILNRSDRIFCPRTYTHGRRADLNYLAATALIKSTLCSIPFLALETC